MLVVNRAINESVVIGNGPVGIEVFVISIAADKTVRLGIKAPQSISVHRREVYDAIQLECTLNPYAKPKRRKSQKQKKSRKSRN